MPVQLNGPAVGQSTVSGDGGAAMSVYAPGGPADGVDAVDALDLLLYRQPVMRLHGQMGFRRREFLTAGRATRVARRVLWVSNAAGNGVPLGNDTNAGTADAPLLTFDAAHTAAVAGDTIMLNGSATPYTSAIASLAKAVFITTNVFRGATLRNDKTTNAWDVGVAGLSFGPIVLDAARTSSGFSAYSVFASGERAGLTFYGTRILGGSTGIFDLRSSAVLYGCALENQVANLAGLVWIRPNGGRVLMLNCEVYGKVSVEPFVAGVPVEISGCSIRLETTGAAQHNLLSVTGAKSVAVNGLQGYVRGVTWWGAFVVTPHATIPCDSVTVRGVTASSGVRSNTAQGYGVAVGAENTGSLQNICAVTIEDCEVSGVNHGIFVGWGVVAGSVRRNIVRDSVIGMIRKGEAIGSIGSAILFECNVVIGGTLTGGAIRVKNTTTGQFVNNTIVFDALSTSAGIAIYATDASSMTARSNIVSGGGSSISQAVWAREGNAIAASGNLYHASSFGAGAWWTPEVLANNFATWAPFDPGSVSADPQFQGAGDYRPSLAGPAVGNPVAATDFDGIAHNARGAFAAA